MFFARLQNESFFFLFRKMWQFSDAQNKRRILFFIAFSIIANITSLVPPYLFGILLNDVQQSGIGQENVQYLLYLLGAILLMTPLFWVFHGTSRIVEQKSSFYVYEKYRNHLLKGVITLPLGWHNERDSGDTIDKVNKAADGLRWYASDVFVFVEIVVRIIGTAAVLILFDWYIAIGVFMFTLVSLFALFRFDTLLVPLYQKQYEFDNRLSAKVFDALSNITSIVILNIRSAILLSLQKEIRAPFEAYTKQIRLGELKWFTGSMLFELLVAIPIGWYILQTYWSGNSLLAGSIGALYLYLSRLSFSFWGFASAYENVLVRRARVQNAEPLERDFLPNAEYRKTAPSWKSLSFKNISFGYDTTTEHLHLNGISLNITQGDRIALIGASGSGKTTLLKVLHGLYDTAQGHIVFDQKLPLKTNFADIDLKTMLVPQEPEVFSASIRENITLGIDYTEKQIMHAAQLAAFAQVVERLPNGLDSVINEKGVNLSGGEKQRLALTRALLFAQNKEIILLDESTSSVDPANESRIYEHISAHFSDAVIIASIHKMNLLKYFDRIVMFDQGLIVGEGTFTELYSKNLMFKQEWDAYIAREGAQS